jgi:hypothetical protein
MALENLTGIFMLECRCRGAGDVVKQVYADREISRVEQADAAFLHQAPHRRQFAVPARGTRLTMFLPGAGAGRDIF